MASTKIKIAYFFFFVFLSIWVIVLLLTCSPSVAWANSVEFSNMLMLILFMLSGSIAAGSCAIIGIDYLGINFSLRHENSIQSVRNQTLVVRRSRVLAAQRSRALAAQECRALVVQESSSGMANAEKLQEPHVASEPEETTQDQLTILVLMPTEEEAKTQKNSAKNQ